MPTQFDHIMVDLETMGNTKDAPIIAIGAVTFDPKTNQLGERFYKQVNLQSSVEQGGKMDPSTVLWWLRQDDSSRSAFNNNESAEHIKIVLHDLINFITTKTAGARYLKLWGNGAPFDNVILGSAFANVGLNQPWQFWNDRCYRTVKNMFPHIKMARSGTHHNALDDAISQASHLMQIAVTQRLDLN